MVNIDCIFINNLFRLLISVHIIYSHICIFLMIFRKIYMNTKNNNKNKNKKYLLLYLCII